MSLDVIKEEHRLLTIEDWAKEANLDSRSASALKDAKIDYFILLLALTEEEINNIYMVGFHGKTSIIEAISKFDEGQYNVGLFKDHDELRALKQDSYGSKLDGYSKITERDKRSAIQNIFVPKPEPEEDPIIRLLSEKLAESPALAKLRGRLSEDFLLKVLRHNHDLGDEFARAIQRRASDFLTKDAEPSPPGK